MTARVAGSQQLAALLSFFVETSAFAQTSGTGATQSVPPVQATPQSALPTAPTMTIRVGRIRRERFDSRYVRLNVQVIEVDRSPASSLFGFYVGGQKGTTVSSAFSFVF
jgi:hypothetical protein